MIAKWLFFFFLFLVQVCYSMKCDEIANSTLPCIEVPLCASSAHDSAVEVQMKTLSDGSGLASSYSNFSICFDEYGLHISQTNYNQGLLTASNSISECNDPVSNSNSASIYIAPEDDSNMQCFTEFDVSPVNISYHAGVFVSRLPVPPQSFEMACNNSGLESETKIDFLNSSWQIDFFLSFATINCPYNCPTPQSNCNGLNTINNISYNRFSDAESVYRANFFRVNEMMVLSGNGQCTALQNTGRCQTLAWIPTPDLHNTSNFGYLLLQFEAEEAYDDNFDDMYKDVMIILAIFVLLVLIIYIWCFQNLKENQLHPRPLGTKSAPLGPSVDVAISGISYYVPVSDEMAKTDSNLVTLKKNGKGYFKQLLHSVNLTIEKNKVTAIMGPSGAG
jgi:ABC-type multidrug transport system fused ATPase/permease subunit